MEMELKPNILHLQQPTEYDQDQRDSVSNINLCLLFVVCLLVLFVFVGGGDPIAGGNRAQQANMELDAPEQLGRVSMGIQRPRIVDCRLDRPGAPT